MTTQMHNSNGNVSPDEEANTPPSTISDECSTDDRIAALEAQVAERNSLYLRALADYQNYQRRAIENESRALTRGAASVARSLVPSLDHFDIAAGQNLADLPPERLLAAVAMLRAELLKGLAAHGVERIDPSVGDEFDPHWHEAVMQMAADGVATGHISLCMQAGYRLGDNAIRPAKVAVAP